MLGERPQADALKDLGGDAMAELAFDTLARTPRDVRANGWRLKQAEHLGGKSRCLVGAQEVLTFVNVQALDAQ